MFVRAESQSRDTSGSLISMRVVRGLADQVERAGACRSKWLEMSGLGVEQLDAADARITRAEVYALFERAVGMTNDPALGLHWCERLSDSVFNPITQLVRHADTLRSGLNALSRFHGLLSDPPSYELIESGRNVTMRCIDLSGETLLVQRFVGEMLVAGFIRILRVFDPRASLAWIGFSHGAPSYEEEYLRILKQPVKFEQPFTGIVFDARMLDLAAPYRDAEIHLALRRFAEQRIAQVEHSLPMSWQVRELLVAKGAKRHLDMPAVARALGMSVRSLRRRLFMEGASFNHLLHEAAASVAKTLLRNEGWSIQETAYEMGFAHTTTFHRAFKHWTGATPKEFLQRQG